MTTRASRSFLHSCLKVPIDPCNNCPAPVYNRPQMYLGRLTTTPLSATVKSLHTTDLENVDSMLVNSGIRSLAKLYDSIPDYKDINHLPNEQFYSTLDTLRSTCCELRTKPACVVEESSTTSSLSSHCVKRKRVRASKTSKSGPSSGKTCGRRKTGKGKTQDDCRKTQCAFGTSDFAKSSDGKCYKEEFEDEVKAFQKTFKDFEEELNKRHKVSSSVHQKLGTLERDTNGNERCGVKNYEDKQPPTPDVSNFRDNFRKTVENKLPSSKASSANFRNLLKKSLSVNDLSCVTDSQKQNFHKDSETQILINRTPLKFSSYFSQKTSISSPGNAPPKIFIESPSTETSSSTRTSSGRKKKERNKRQPKDFQVPFSIFNLGTKKENQKHNTPSPIHPVARPNLAATLRAEVSKKKLRELQNNCTYNDSTPQFDWEVRKTPAWKSLSLNETHKEILSMRLATRKAEQAMQQRDYELNMELMRQRVKSAPLLLEGATFWGPHIGKLTHTCHREGVSHSCQSKQRKSRSKSADSRRFLPREDISSQNSQRSSKINLLHKIYGGYSKEHRNNATQRPVTRNTTHSTEKKRSDELKVPQTVNDSGDDLSSLDRAFL
ncbi:unnamed protein product [Ceratitis capitata]|uniref:(Mediterranean fruit fly) hypothetical protein n=1 Tax=Ceratitis capitata TaxID=7213 RepID=A0A811TYY8_CERCA|nr:unnamed protein product [Ceratitis capitata]